MNRHEQGQITVIMLIAVIALLGVATLAIDGGMLYLERREAQSAADNAAMSGALALTRGYSVAELHYIVQAQAVANGFSNSLEGVEVVVLWPPQEPNPYAGNLDFVQVIITSRIHTAFIHFVYQGAVEVTVEAVAHAGPRDELAAGYALFGVNETACQTMWFTGNPDVRVTGGGSVGSNSINGCDCGSFVTGGTFTASVEPEGQFTVAINDSAVGCWVNNSGPGSINPEPITRRQVSKHQFSEFVPTPKCSSTVEPGLNVNGFETINPGTYEYLKVRAQGELHLKPGLYCISGSLDGWGLETKGGSVLYGEEVMIYLMESAGGLKTAGTSKVNLYASTLESDPWKGMIIHVDPNNSNDVILTGTSNSEYVGTVLSIGSHCDVEGTAGVEFTGQVICDTVRVNGNGELIVNYNADFNYFHPANVELAQ